MLDYLDCTTMQVTAKVKRFLNFFKIKEMMKE
jgi:hypothetical protein